MASMTEPFHPWTTEHILGLTLNSATAVQAQRLAQPSQWQDLGRDATRIWGSAPDPSRRGGGNPGRTETAVDLSILQVHGESMACTCDIHMPCAHIMALLLLFAQDETAFPVQTAVPLFVRERVRLTRPIIRSDEVMRPEIERGLTMLDRWLTNFVHQGLGEQHARDADVWDEIGKQMLAARMPALSQWLRETGRRAVYGRDWVEPLLEELGRMYLLVRSFDRFDQLPFEVQADIRDALGWRLTEGERERVTDDWYVLGQRQRTLVDKMPEQLTWLYGLNSKRMALLHSLGSEEIVPTAPFVVGAMLHAEVAYLPSRVPLKAELVTLEGRAENAPVQGMTIPQAVEGFGLALARNPWLRHYPVLLDDVYVARFNKGWIVRHADGSYLPLAPYFRHKWVLHGIGGGAPLRVGGVWDGHVLFPLSASAATGVINLNRVAAYTMARQGIKTQTALT